MNRIPVSSSTVLSVGYDIPSMILEVEFKNRSIYQYIHVPYAHYQGLMGASSKGGYLDAYIKKGGYQYKQIK